MFDDPSLHGFLPINLCFYAIREALRGRRPRLPKLLVQKGKAHSISSRSSVSSQIFVSNRFGHGLAASFHLFHITSVQYEPLKQARQLCPCSSTVRAADS